MPQVTVPLVSTNNLQNFLSDHSSTYNSALAHHRMGFSQCKTTGPTMEATGIKGPFLSGAVQGLELSRGIRSALNIS